jgi:response regulator RpfG family c-di-GMP phosphodiesterase
MQRHCAIGAELLSGGHSDIIRMAERIALTHHERWDGQGYPHGLQAEEIPIEGRILAIADVFDALTHERPYKKAWTIEGALDELKNQSGQHLDPQIVDCFVELAAIRRRVLGRRVSGRRELNARGADVPARVLVVDDERDIVAFIKANLERAGYQVSTAVNGREALERVVSDKPDLILLDQMMPEMDGFEVLRNLKGDEATNNIPVVMLTAIEAPADVVKGWESGTALYLVKPIMPKELLEFIQCVLE